MATRWAWLCGIVLCLLSLLILLWGRPKERLGPPGPPATLGQRVPDENATCLEQDNRLDLNTAGPEELQSLPGVGPVLAQRIVEYRRNNPPFRRVEELLIIRGISRRRFERVQQEIRVTAPTLGPNGSLDSRFAAGPK